MRRSRLPLSPLSAYVVLFIACLGLFAGSTLTGCSQNQRAETVRASFVAVNAAREGFTTWDKGHQQQIVATATSRDDGEQRLAAYRAQRAAVVSDFEVAYHALAVATTQTDKLSLDAAVREANELVAAIDRLLHPPPAAPATPVTDPGVH